MEVVFPVLPTVLIVIGCLIDSASKLMAPECSSSTELSRGLFLERHLVVSLNNPDFEDVDVDGLIKQGCINAGSSCWELKLMKSMSAIFICSTC